MRAAVHRAAVRATRPEGTALTCAVVRLEAGARAPALAQAASFSEESWNAPAAINVAPAITASA